LRRPPRLAPAVAAVIARSATLALAADPARRAALGAAAGLPLLAAVVLAALLGKPAAKHTAAAVRAFTERGPVASSAAAQLEPLAANLAAPDLVGATRA